MPQALRDLGRQDNGVHLIGARPKTRPIRILLVAYRREQDWSHNGQGWQSSPPSIAACRPYASPASTSNPDANFRKRDMIFSLIGNNCCLFAGGTLRLVLANNGADSCF
jgi:hypothetical protein